MEQEKMARLDWEKKESPHPFLVDHCVMVCQAFVVNVQCLLSPLSFADLRIVSLLPHSLHASCVYCVQSLCLHVCVLVKTLYKLLKLHNI